MRIEHWTAGDFSISLDGKTIKEGANPWGTIPFIFNVRQRTTTPYGDSLAKDIMAPQDEINMRLADASEALNYNLHPTRWGLNLPSAFNDKNFPIGADSMWDFGRAMNKDMKPEVGVLEIKNPVPDALFKYVDFLYDWSRTASFAPPIAFGEDDGGGQRSGVTLEIRLWPLLKALRTSRAFMANSVSRGLKITGKILAQKKISDFPAYMIDALIEGEVVPRFQTDHAARSDCCGRRSGQAPGCQDWPGHLDGNLPGSPGTWPGRTDQDHEVPGEPGREGTLAIRPRAHLRGQRATR